MSQNTEHDNSAGSVGQLTGAVGYVARVYLLLHREQITPLSFEKQMIVLWTKPGDAGIRTIAGCKRLQNE